MGENIVYLENVMIIQTLHISNKRNMTIYLLEKCGAIFFPSQCLYKLKD